MLERACVLSSCGGLGCSDRMNRKQQDSALRPWRGWVRRLGQGTANERDGTAPATLIEPSSCSVLFILSTYGVSGLACAETRTLKRRVRLTETRFEELSCKSLFCRQLQNNSDKLNSVHIVRAFCFRASETKPEKSCTLCAGGSAEPPRRQERHHKNGTGGGSTGSPP